MEAVKELETGLKKLDDTSYNSIDKLMRGIMKKNDMSAKELHNAFVKKHKKTPDAWINEMKDPKGPVKPYRSPQEIAKKHKVSLDKIINQVKMGTKVEGEHTTSKSGARITALQHVDELPDYYTRLKKVEKKKTVKETLETAQMGLEGKRYCKLCRKAETAQECSYGPELWKKFSIATIHPTNESKIKVEDTCLTFSQFMQLTEVAAWQRKEGKNQSGGLNEKGRKSYERENPGSDLKAPSKKVGNPRRASFCARMKGMKSKLTSAKTANDPNSRINKSLRSWNC